jgi:uncharacterized membrane protein YgaE (UPF0421/DUF939 family)
MKIGMRNIKTGIAVALCIAISKIFKMEYPFYAAIAAVISMQNTVSDSFKAGKNRMLGTMVGALIGLVSAIIMPGNIILCGIGIILVIFICDKLNWNKSLVIACIVFCAIMTNLKGRNPYLYSLNRLLDTFLGITSAMLVNYFILPPNYFKKLQEHGENMKLHTIFCSASALYRRMLL